MMSLTACPALGWFGILISLGINVSHPISALGKCRQSKLSMSEVVYNTMTESQSSSLELTAEAFRMRMIFKMRQRKHHE